MFSPIITLATVTIILRMLFTSGTEVINFITSIAMTLTIIAVIFIVFVIFIFYLKDSNYIGIFYCFSTFGTILNNIIIILLSANPLCRLSPQRLLHLQPPIHTQVDPCLILCKVYFLSRSGLPVGIWRALWIFRFPFISLKLIIQSSILIPLNLDLY